MKRYLWTFFMNIIFVILIPVIIPVTAFTLTFYMYLVAYSFFENEIDEHISGTALLTYKSKFEQTAINIMWNLILFNIVKEIIPIPFLSLTWTFIAVIATIALVSMIEIWFDDKFLRVKMEGK